MKNEILDILKEQLIVALNAVKFAEKRLDALDGTDLSNGDAFRRYTEFSYMRQANAERYDRIERCIAWLDLQTETDGSDQPKQVYTDLAAKDMPRKSRTKCAN